MTRLVHLKKDDTLVLKVKENLPEHMLENMRRSVKAFFRDMNIECLILNDSLEIDGVVKKSDPEKEDLGRLRVMRRKYAENAIAGILSNPSLARLEVPAETLVYLAWQVADEMIKYEDNLCTEENSRGQS